MDYSKIRLANERNSHVTKRLNRLNTWKFFGVLYRDNLWRVFGFSILMILCLAPVFAVLFLRATQTSYLQLSLPMLNGFGFSTGVWADVGSYYAAEMVKESYLTGLYVAVSAMLFTLTLSGGFAVIRDAFWTGKLSTVGVFKSMGKGIAANLGYAFVSTAIIAFSSYGIFALYQYMSLTLPLWAAIVITVLLAIVAMFLFTYLLILCSVTVTYKQPIADSIDDAWRLLWLNILPNIIHFMLALLPIPLYFVFQGGMLQTLFLVVMLMFGGMYFPLVWQTHMMRTFALFHPVEVKKKKNG